MHYFGQPKIRISNQVGGEARSAIDLYDRRLVSNQFPIIYSPEHFAQLVGMKVGFLYSVSNQQGSHYRCFAIPKRNGGKRVICEPLPNLKLVQRWILDNILTSVELHDAAKAYRAGYSVKDNAKFHREREFVYQIDVEDFFGSISYFKVNQIFRDFGYTKAVAMLLAKICTLGGALPQGAPTSGALSNVVLTDFDTDLFAFARSMSLRYTRYADDITISGDEIDFRRVTEFVRCELRKQNLKLNSKKTRILRKWQKQKVTGIVVNKKLSIDRSIIKELRQVVYYIEKYGLFGHLRMIQEKEPEFYLDKLIGMAAHAKFVKTGDENLKRYHKFLVEVRRDTDF